MNYETALIVFLVVAIPVSVFVGYKMYSRWRQPVTLDSVESDSSVYELNPEPGEVKFGDGTAGAKPPVSDNNLTDTYRYGGGDGVSDESYVTTVELLEPYDGTLSDMSEEVDNDAFLDEARSEEEKCD